MKRSVDYVDALVREHNIQSEYWFPGFLRAATTPGYTKRIQHDLERDIVWLFPGLKDVRITHRWGGPVSVPVDMAPAIGQIGDPRAVYSLGCVGHGVSMTHLNGCTLADLVLERKTDLTDTWFVNRRTIPWPPEPLRMAASQAIRGYLRIEDALYERQISKEVRQSSEKS